MKKCPECHSQNSDSSLFCASCGASLAPEKGMGRRGQARPGSGNRPHLYQSCLNAIAAIFLVCLFACAVIAVFAGKGCREEDTHDTDSSDSHQGAVEPGPAVPTLPGPTLRPVFDVPRLLTLTYAQIRRALGKPQSSFSPTAEMLRLDPDMTWSDTYERGVIQLQIEFDRPGRVVYAFISDTTYRMTPNQLMQVGNIVASSNTYTTRAQAAWDPGSRTFSPAKITGLHIYPKAPYARDEWGKPI